MFQSQPRGCRDTCARTCTPYIYTRSEAGINDLSREISSFLRTISRFIGHSRCVHVIMRLELTLTRRWTGKGHGVPALPRSGSGFKRILDAPRAVRDFLRVARIHMYIHAESIYACTYTHASGLPRFYRPLCLL